VDNEKEYCKCGARIRAVKASHGVDVKLDYELATVYQLDNERKLVVGASYGYRLHECDQCASTKIVTQLDLVKKEK